MGAEQVVVSADRARRFCQEVFRRAGVPGSDAFLVADALIDAEMIREIETAPRAEGVAEISLPGEREFRRREERLQRGLPVRRAVLLDAQAIGGELGVPWPA